MYKQALRAYLEGRGSLAKVQEAIARSPRSAALQKAASEELAADWEFKALFAALPTPPAGLPRLLKALRAARLPALDAATAAVLAELSQLHEGLKNIPPPAGGYPAALQALKAKIAAAPPPAMYSAHGDESLDIQPQLEATPSGRHLVLLESSRKRGVTRKIIGLPKTPPASRDVLAAQKDDEDVKR